MNDRNIMIRRAQYRSLGLGAYYDRTIKRFGSTIFVPDNPFTQTCVNRYGNRRKIRRNS